MTPFTLFSFLFLGALPPSLQEIRKTFEPVQSFEVDFTQKVEQDIFKDSTEKASGKVTFKKPKSFVWEYLKPMKKKISFDGTRLQIEEGKEKEQITDFGQLPFQEAFSFLWGHADQKIFKFSKVDHDSFRLEPVDPKSAHFRSILVEVKKGRVSQAIITDHLDGRSILEFGNWKLKR